MVLHFVRWENEHRGVAVLESDAREIYITPLTSLVRLRAVDGLSARSPADVLEDRLYRRRSRSTAQQRANRRLTPAQMRTLFALAHRRGMDAEELRAMTPQRSIRALTIREAGALIERLRGAVATAQGAGGA